MRDDANKKRGRRRGKGGQSKRKKPAQPRAPTVKVSSVDTDRPADEALTKAEVADMRRHLAFVRKYRRLLRLKLNATEDLLVNGIKEPDHRGVCKHLLGKVDRSTVVSALAREPVRSDEAARAEFLAGAAAISGDAGILLSYLETLTSVVSRETAATAFAQTVERIDFEAISAARMARLLEIVQATFSDYARVQVMFGLLQSASFRRAFDASVESFEAGLADRFVPLRAVWETVADSGKKGKGEARQRGRRPQPPREALEAGLRELLAAPPGVLRGYPKRTRERLLDVLMTSASGWPYDHPGVRRLLESLPDDGEMFRRQAYRCACGLVRQGLDDEARALLERVAAAHPKFGAARRLLAALSRPMLGRYALDRAPAPNPPASVQHADCLQRLRPVWLRWGRRGDGERFVAEAALHARLIYPGITPLLDSGETIDGVPFVSADGTLPRLTARMADKRRRPSLDVVLSLARSGVAICRLLGSLGIVLPDARADRFLVDLGAGRPVLELVDLAGALSAEASAASERMAVLAIQHARSAFRYPPYQGRQWRRDLPAALRQLLEAWRDAPPDLATLQAKLAEAAEALNERDV